MKNKLIRLTEGDLHRIVKESVNKVLTELDWKTYANAAKKSKKMGRNAYAGDFYKAARNAYDSKYGVNYDTYNGKPAHRLSSMSNGELYPSNDERGRDYEDLILS